MPNPLNLFPARVPIGRITGADGRSYDVLMTQEFSRALADLLVRVGGGKALDNNELSALASVDADVGQVLALPGQIAELRAMLEQVAPAVALQGQIAELRALVEQVAPAVAVYQQIEAMRVELAMIEDPAAQVRYVQTRFAPLLSPTFTGTPKAPTAALDTDTDQLATTKFVLNQASDVAPLANGAIAAPGGSERYSRADHVHPTDTSRQAKITAATVTGSRAGNAALTSLLTGLAGQGLINDTTTA